MLRVHQVRSRTAYFSRYAPGDRPGIERKREKNGERHRVRDQARSRRHPRRHFIFTDEHEELRESMRPGSRRRCHPHRYEWEENLWPDSILKRAGELGFVGLCFPEEYGGQGGDYFYSLVRAECMSYSGCGGLNMGIAVHTDMATPPIHLLGTEEQKQRYLVPVDQGREDQLPRDHRAGRRLRRRRHPHHRQARRRRVRDQRLQDVHHQRRSRRLHRARHQDRSRRAATTGSRSSSST